MTAAAPRGALRLIVHLDCGGIFRDGFCERCGGELALVLPELEVDFAGRLKRSSEAKSAKSIDSERAQDGAAPQEKPHFADFAELRGDFADLKPRDIAEEHPTLRGFEGSMGPHRKNGRARG